MKCHGDKTCMVQVSTKGIQAQFLRAMWKHCELERSGLLRHLQSHNKEKCHAI